PQDLPDALRIPRDRDRLLVVVGTIPFGDPASPPAILLFPFGGRSAGVGQSESLDRLGGLFGGQRSRQRRIDPAAQKEPDRDIGHQPARDRPTHSRQQLVGGLA